MILFGQIQQRLLVGAGQSTPNCPESLQPPLIRRWLGRRHDSSNGLRYEGVYV